MRFRKYTIIYLNFKISKRNFHLNRWYGQKHIYRGCAYKGSGQSWFISTSPVIMPGFGWEYWQQNNKQVLLSCRYYCIYFTRPFGWNLGMPVCSRAWYIDCRYTDAWGYHKFALVNWFSLYLVHHCFAISIWNILADIFAVYKMFDSHRSKICINFNSALLL